MCEGQGINKKEKQRIVGTSKWRKQFGDAVANLSSPYFDVCVYVCACVYEVL